MPASLKEVVFRPVLKKVSLDPEMATNYRLVASIPFLGKVLELVVARKLQVLLDETDYLDSIQFGFIPGYGTESALVSLYDDLSRERDRGSASLLVLLDLSVAFNTINHGEAVAVLNWCLDKIMGWMRANKLKLNPDKMEVLLNNSVGWEVGCLPVLDGIALLLEKLVDCFGMLLNPSLSEKVQMISAIETGPQKNYVAFGKKDAAQETSPRGQDGEDLHGHHGLPLGAQNHHDSFSQNGRNSNREGDAESSLSEKAGEPRGLADEEEGAEEAEQERNEKDVGEVSVVGFDDWGVVVFNESCQH
ncbi:RNA-directed DNA polymerase from mobile element jockey [Varanus komodoensis]|nr:RNA-directed DNA polymerase from mobile element jockey [Varanus komodoensis]